MELIAMILFIVVAVLSSKDRKKKAAQQTEARRANTGAAAREAAVQKPAAQKPAGQMSLAERQARMNELRQRQQERKAAQPTVHTPEQAASEAFQESLGELEALLNARPAASGQGASMLDDDECAGGSMAHEHTEGESHEEHARHIAALKERDAEEDRQARAAADMAALNARRLRQAVVMAEVLDRPKALRMRRGA